MINYFLVITHSMRNYCVAKNIFLQSILCLIRHNDDTPQNIPEGRKTGTTIPPTTSPKMGASLKCWNRLIVQPYKDISGWLFIRDTIVCTMDDHFVTHGLISQRTILGYFKSLNQQFAFFV